MAGSIWAIGPASFGSFHLGSDGSASQTESVFLRDFDFSGRGSRSPKRAGQLARIHIYWVGPPHQGILEREGMRWRLAAFFFLPAQSGADVLFLVGGRYFLSFQACGPMKETGAGRWRASSESLPGAPVKGGTYQIKRELPSRLKSRVVRAADTLSGPVSSPAPRRGKRKLAGPCQCNTYRKIRCNRDIDSCFGEAQ